MAAIAASHALGAFGSVGQVWAAQCTASTLTVVAHEDDDLLFTSPDLVHSVQSATAGACVRTVVVTAGDAGQGLSYALGREAGSMAAYAEMAGVANVWTQADAGLSGHPAPLFTLSGAPNVSLVFLRLPDGNPTGTGYWNTNGESLQELWQGSITTIDAIDGSSSYTSSSLISALEALLNAFQPTQIRTQDYVGTFGDNDHSDHHAVAYYTLAAHDAYLLPHTFTGYMGYGTADELANVSGADLTAKENAFFAYAPHDSVVCGSVSSCAGTPYGDWMTRQYTVGSQSGGGGPAPVANAGPAQVVVTGSLVQLDGSASSDSDGGSLTYAWTQTAGPTVSLSAANVVKPTFTAPATPATLSFQLVVEDGLVASAPSTVTVTVLSSTDGDVALAATATASSQDTSTGQTASKAIDGVVDGYPGDYTKEWATVGGGAGSYLLLTWSTPVTLAEVQLYDRPNLNDQITAATLQFSDGSTLSVPTLPNDGSALTLTFPARATTSLRLSITAVSSTTQNIGLAELKAWGTAQSNQVPVANAGPDQSVGAGSTVQLDGTASADSDGDLLTYSWTQTAGPAVSLSSASVAKPTFTAPGTSATLSFQLVVSDGLSSSAPDTVTITVLSSTSNDVALTAKATASSQNTATGQTASKAIDGVVGGYPTSPTNEWATLGGGAGSYLLLKWSTAVTIASVQLYDRPNLNDQITAATLRFSDGSTITVPTLPNDGSALTLTFPAKATTSLRLSITAVSSTTQNIGLAELKAWSP